MEGTFIFHDLLLFACRCNGQIFGMLWVRRRGDDALRTFLDTFKVASVLQSNADRQV